MRLTDPEYFRAPADEADAVALQTRLRALVQPDGRMPALLRTIAGLDVAYAVDESVVAGAVTVLDATTLEVIESATAVRPVEFPYVPGLLSFREIPALLDALDKLTQVPDVLVCDGYGLAHPRRFGLACHVGLLTGLPTFGVAKTAFIGTFTDPGNERGDSAELIADANADGESGTGTEPKVEPETIGRVLRTRTGVKPVFVSVGHRIGLDEACALTLRLTPEFRLPETTRRADRLSRVALAEAEGK